jgi:hypothetical protein
MWFIWNYVCVCTQLHGHSICKNCQNLSWGIFFLEAMCLHFLGVWGQDTFPFCAQTLSFPLHHPLLNNITLSDSQFYQDGLYFNAHLSYHTHTHTQMWKHTILGHQSLPRCNIDLLSMCFWFWSISPTSSQDYPLFHKACPLHHLAILGVHYHGHYVAGNVSR